MSVLAHAATSASSGSITIIILPAIPEPATSAILSIEPPTIGSNVKLTRVPSPAGKKPPDKSKPSTIPVPALNEISLKSPLAPVRVTPETSNWNP